MANKKKPTETKKEPVVKSPEPVERAEPVEESSRWGIGSIFWGLLLITIGVLALLNNFGIIVLNLAGLSQLWPLLFVVWGISMLNVKGMLWRSLMLLMVVAVLGFVVWVAVGAGDFGSRQATVRQTETVAQLDTAVKKVDLYIDAGASKVNVGSEDMKDELRAVLDSNVSSLKKTSSRNGDTERIDLKLESRNQWWISGVRNELDVTLARHLPTLLSLKLGAADLKADLSEVKVDQLKLDIGAASADVRLGANRDNLAVTVNAGASSIDMHIPKNSGVRVEIEGGVSSKEFEGLKNKGDGIYESSNYASAERKVKITGDIGATSFKIDRY